MSSDKSTNRFYIEKLGATNPKKFVGDAGEIFYDPTEGELRLSDGETEGGIPATQSIADAIGFIPEDAKLYKSVRLNSNTEYGNIYADYEVGDNEIVIGQGSEVIFDRFNHLDEVSVDSLHASGLNVDGVSNLGFLQPTQKVTGNITLDENTEYYSFSQELVVDPYIEIVVGSGSTVTMDKLSQIEGTGGGGGTSSQWVTTSAGIHTLSKVGIGTTNPFTNLQVNGDLVVSAGVDTTKYVKIKAYEDNGGTLSFEGTQGQLFSITNNLTSGSIFNVNDINANPILDANANGNLGIGTTNPTEKLTVVGDARVTGILTVGTASITLDGSNNTIGVGTGVSIDGNFGVVYSTTFVGDGSGLVGIVTNAVGTEIYEDGNARGTATKINFGNGFNVDPVTSSCANVSVGLDALYNFSVGNGGSDGCFNVFLGYDAGKCHSTGWNNFIVGNSAGYCNTGSYNNFFGYHAGYYNTGCYNTFFGDNAGLLNSGNHNNFFGCCAGRYNTTGSCNNFFGWVSGYCNTTGSDNNFIGYSAGKYNTTGYGNNFIGKNTGYSNTTGYYNNFFGNFTGYNNTTGCYNSFFGQNSGNGNTTGYYNSFFGSYAGFRNTTGCLNTFVGFYAGQSTTASNKVVIGSALGGTGAAFDAPDTTKDTQFAVGIKTDANPANYWIVGNENFNIGIGQTNPQYKLDVGGDVNFTGTLYQNGVAFSGGGGGSSQWVTTQTGIYTTSSVSIGTTIVSQQGSSAKVHISGGNLKLDSNISLVWDGTYPTYILGNSGPSGRLTFTVGNNGKPLVLEGFSLFPGDNSSIDLGTSSNQYRNFWIGGTQIIGSATSTGTLNQKLQVNSSAYVSGNLGIGTTNPVDKLTVQSGNIRVGVNTSNGLILTDANGVSWRLIVKIDGSLATVAV